MFYSGITGGQVPVNYAGFTVVLFPLSIGYAVVKHDLFEIDALVKRSVYYISITATLLFAYLGFLGLTNWMVRSEIARSPLFPLLFTFAVVLLFNPLKDAMQRTVDRVFFRMKYDPRKVLGATSAALASTLQLDGIIVFVWHTIEKTTPVTNGGVFIRSPERHRHECIFPPFHAAAFADDHPLITHLVRSAGRVTSRYDLNDESFDGSGALSALDLLEAELLIPLAVEDELIGFIALGKKESGQFLSGRLRVSSNAR